MTNTESPTEPAPFDPAAHGWEIDDDVAAFMVLVGPVWRKPDGDGFRYAFAAEDKHGNRRGVVHGGMLTTFADRSMGRACWHANGQQPQATAQLDVHFVDAVRIGDFVECRCTVVRKTRAVVFMRGELTVGDRVVATANGVWKVLGRG